MVGARISGTLELADVEIHGAHPGVGLRQRVHRLARALHLTGHVANAGGHLLVHVAGTPAAVEEFLFRLSRHAPERIRIRVSGTSRAEGPVPADFTILDTGLDRGARVVAPDLATCADCLAELRDPYGKRYRYPFISCAACGPRASIATGLPYDRSRTTMAGLPPCPECTVEYRAVGDRRFHAETIGCPKCGPRLRWTSTEASADGEDAFATAVGALALGEVVSVQGVGGHRLLCDARVADRLRDRGRWTATMVADLDGAARLGALTPATRRLLTSRAAPVVLLDRGDGAETAVKLADDPLHHMLLGDLGRPLAFADADGGPAGGVLTYDRGVANPMPDPVMRVLPGDRVQMLRTGRGHRTYPDTAGRHHSHVVAVATEHHVPAPFIGVSYDGHPDGSWLGEILLAGYSECLLVGRVAYAPRGGEASGSGSGRVVAASRDTLVNVTAGLVSRVARRTFVQAVCLGGAAFESRWLAEGVVTALEDAGLGVFVGATVPCELE